MGDRVIVSCVMSKFVIRSLSFELLEVVNKLRQINLNLNQICRAERSLKILITYVQFTGKFHGY